jgi:hypothetical protein
MYVEEYIATAIVEAIAHTIAVDEEGGTETTDAQYSIREALTGVVEPESTLVWEVV